MAFGGQVVHCIRRRVDISLISVHPGEHNVVGAGEGVCGGQPLAEESCISRDLKSCLIHIVSLLLSC